MPVKLRVTINCIFTAALAVGAVWLMVYAQGYMFRQGFFAFGWFSDHFSSEFQKPAIFIYDIIQFGIFGSLCAAVMLGLRPRSWLFYSLASVAPLFFVFQISGVISTGDKLSMSISIVWLLAIPFLFWLFDRVEKKWRDKSFNTNASDTGTV